MDTIFINGNIRTMDEAGPRAEALAVECGKIRRVGSTDEIRELAGSARQVIDLAGRTVFPGFIDVHNHFGLYAFLIDQADCRPAAGCVRGSDVIEALREKARTTPAGRWIMGWGYAPYLLADKKELNRADLDLVSTEHPICLVHVSVHGAVVNSRALAELGFTKDTPDPPGGLIHRSETGEPNGILSESAFMNPLFFANPSIQMKMMAAYDREQRVEMMQRCAAAYHRLGIVGAHDPFVDAQVLRTYQEAAAGGCFPFRMYAYILNEWADPLIRVGIPRGFGSDLVKVGAIKLFLDGGMSSRTAAVFEPYHGGGGGTGILNYDQAALDAQIRKFDRAGYQISVHAQGDRALAMLLQAFDRTIDPGNPLRHHIVHAGNLTAEQIDRVAELGLYITSQANFFSLLGDGFIEAYGPERSQMLYRFKTIIQKGIRFALSSDCPVAEPNPLIGVRDAVLRRTAGGEIIGPDECLTAEKAFSLYTREAAWFSHEEEEKGVLAEGRLADLVVLDTDPLEMEIEKITDCRVTMTVVGGRTVYQAE